MIFVLQDSNAPLVNTKRAKVSISDLSDEEARELHLQLATRIGIGGSSMNDRDHDLHSIHDQPRMQGQGHGQVPLAVPAPWSNAIPKTKLNNSMSVDPTIGIRERDHEWCSIHSYSSDDHGHSTRCHKHSSDYDRDYHRDPDHDHDPYNCSNHPHHHHMMHSPFSTGPMSSNHNSVVASYDVNNIIQSTMVPMQRPPNTLANSFPSTLPTPQPQPLVAAPLFRFQ